MSKLPSDDEKPARILRGALDQIVDVAHTVQEAIWEPSVRAAMRGELGPALEKFLEGKVPPPRTRAALTKALARLNKPRKGRPPKYWGHWPSESGPGHLCCAPGGYTTSLER